MAAGAGAAATGVVEEAVVALAAGPAPDCVGDAGEAGGVVPQASRPTAKNA
jgi:hypothetical protein